MKTDKFPLQLEVMPLWNKKWRFKKLLSDFAYVMEPGAKAVMVPDGFLTDFASVPRIFWSILPAWGRYGPAAVIHDYLYSEDCQREVPNPDNPQETVKITRKTADRIFLRAMKDCGVNWFHRRIIYRAVRLGGWAGYEEKK